MNFNSIPILNYHQSLTIAYVNAFVQDFADIVTQPTLEGPSDSGSGEEEQNKVHESVESGFLSASAMNTLVQVHQCLCLGYARSLWYHNKVTASHGKESIKAMISSYQIAGPVMSHFYHLIGWYLCMSNCLGRLSRASEVCSFFFFFFLPNSDFLWGFPFRC